MSIYILILYYFNYISKNHKVVIIFTILMIVLLFNIMSEEKTYNINIYGV